MHLCIYYLNIFYFIKCEMNNYNIRVIYSYYESYKKYEVYKYTLNSNIWIYITKSAPSLIDRSK